MEHIALVFFGRSLSPLFTKSWHGWIFPQGHKLNVAGTRWASYHQQTISPPNVYLAQWPTVHVGKCLWHSSTIYTLALAHSYVFCSQYTDGLGSGVHCIKKRLSFVRPMHQVRPSLPFSHTHSAQSITNLDTARDHLTHTGAGTEPGIGWRRRAAPSDACLPFGSSLDVIGDRGSLVNDNDLLINSWGPCLIGYAWDPGFTRYK